jgi:hypothetical protein
MRTSLAILAVVLLCAISCRSRDPVWEPDITVRNDSTNHLDWASVEWGGHSLDVGVMHPGNEATYLYQRIPSDITTNLAVIRFINEDSPGLNWKSGSNEEVRSRRAKSWTEIPVDVSHVLLHRHERCDITFRILSLTNAEVLIQRITE